MSDVRVGSRLAALLGAVKPKTKQPVSAKVLNTWIAQAEGQLGDEAKAGRLGWLIASSVAIAAVQRAVDADGRHLFLLKGGTLLQHRLSSTARTTEARALGIPSRPWPPTVTAYPHWKTDYDRAAASAGIELPLDVAVTEVNRWIAAIADNGEDT